MRLSRTFLPAAVAVALAISALAPAHRAPSAPQAAPHVAPKHRAATFAPKLAAASVSLPAGCSDFTAFIFCSYSADNSAHVIGLSSGAYNVSYTAAGGAGGGGGGQSGHGGGGQGNGATVTGSLGNVGGHTLYIGAGKAGHGQSGQSTGDATNPMTTCGQFNGGNGGNGTGEGGSGGQGGAASVVCEDGSSLLVVAGGGGGGGGTYSDGACCGFDITRTGGGGGAGGTGAGRANNETGSNGGDGGSGTGGGGGGGGGGYWAGNGGGGSGGLNGGGGGQGGGNSTQNGASASSTTNGNNSGDGYVQLTYYRTAPTVSATAPSATVYAWQSGLSIPVSVSSSRGAATGTVTATDSASGGSQVCTATLSGGSGNCALSASQLTVGSHTLTLNYGGDSGYTSATGSVTFTVTAVPVTVGIDTKPQSDGTVSITATAKPKPGLIAAGSLSLSASPSSSALTNSCATVTSPGPSESRRDQPLSLTCTPAMLPGKYALTATFTGTPSVSANATNPAQPGTTVTVDKYTPTVSLKFAPSVLAEFGDTTVATVQVAEPSGAQADPTGTVSVTPDSGSGGTCTGTEQGKSGLTVTYTCSLTPDAGDQHYTAHFLGDANYLAQASPSVVVSTTAATPVLTLTPSATSMKVGDVLTLTAGVVDNSGHPVSAGTVSFYDGAVSPDGHNLVGILDLTTAPGGGNLQITPNAGQHRYTALYQDAAGNYSQVAVDTQVNVQPLQATMAVAANAASADATSAGIPTTVTVTLTADPQDTKPVTTLGITPAPATPCTVVDGSAGGKRVITWTCSYVEKPGSTPEFDASYTDDLLATVTGTENSYVIPASPTSASVTATDVDYGAEPTITATVTPTVTGTAVAGTVAMTEGSATLCTATVALVSGSYQATCSPTTAPHAGGHSVVATFTPDVVANPVTLASPASSAASFTVRKDPVSIALSTSQTSTELTVSVVADVDGSDPTAPTPTGSISFGDDISSCQTVALSGGVAQCVIDLPAAGTQTTLTATYVPSSDFSAGTTPTVSTGYQRPSSGPCSTAFDALWTLAKNHPGGFDEDAGDLGSVHLHPGTNLGNCDRAATLNLTADVSLFSGTLTATAMSASATQNGLCLNSGSLALPSVWNAGSLSVSQAICLPLTSSGGAGAPTSGALTLARNSTAQLPLVSVPGVTGAASLTARIGTACGGVIGATGCSSPATAVSLTGVVPAASATVPGVTVAATVGTDGSLSGSVTSTAMSVLGGSIVLAGTVSRASKTAPLAASVSATLAQPATPVPGLTLLAGSTVTLQGATGSSPTLGVAGTVRIAAGTPAQVDVAVSGSFTSADDYDLALATVAPAPTWTPVAGLSLTPNLSGTLHRAAGKTTFSLSASGAGGAALADWAAPGGAQVEVDAISLGGDPTTTDLACPYTSGLVAAISGGVTIGGLSVAAAGCVSLDDGGWHVGTTVKNATLGPLSLTSLVLNATHPGGGTTTITGSAVAGLTVGSFSASTTVTMHMTDGSFVVGGQIDATGLGLPSVSTYLAYASAATKAWQTGLPSIGQGGAVDLPAGVSLFGSLKLPAAVASVLTSAHFSIPADSTVTFEATVPTGATGITFTAALNNPSGFPLLRLPSGSTIDSAGVTYSAGTFGLTADGTVKGQDGSAAPLHLAVTISASGDFSGSASVKGLSLFGRTLDLSGSVSRTNGTVAANVTGTLTGSVQVGDATISNVSITLGTAGLSATGTIAVASTSLSFTASFTSTSSYSLSVSTTIDNWTPVSGVTVNATITGTLSRSAGAWTYDFTATPASGTSLITLSAGTGATITMQGFELSNSTNLPSGCSVTSAGDTWLSVTGSVAISLGPASGTANGAGCFDLTKPAFTMTVSVSGAGFGGAGGKVTFGNLTVTISKPNGGAFAVTARARLNVQMPSGGQFSINAVLTVGENGFAIGGAADLSSYLGGSAASAYLFYANTSISVDTGDPTLKTLKLKPGVTVGLDFVVSDSVSQALDHMGLSIGAGTSLAATVNLDLANATVQLTVSLAFQATNIFSLSNGTYLRADSMSLQMTLAPTGPSFAFVASATLHVPSTVPGGSPSDIGLTGGISIGTQLVAFFTISNWNDAFGIRGLVLSEFTLQGGITLTGLPLPSLAATATVTGLPSTLSNLIGYQQGAPISISLALSETQLLLDLKIGTQDSSTPALEPFAFFGKADLLTVTYAELYISPTGATIGTTVYPPGFALGFQGSIAGVSVDVLAKINPVAMSFSFVGKLGQINIGALSIGPTTLSIDASPTSFDIGFTGHLAIGPATTDIGPALRFSGYLSADVSISVGTSGISAHLNLDASVSASEYLPQGWCKWHGIWILCDYEWVDDPPLTIHLDNIGFDINGSGLTVDIPDTTSSITFPFPGHSGATETAQALGPYSGPRTQTLDLAKFGVPVLSPPTRPHASAPASAAAAWQPTGAMGQKRIVAGSIALRDGSVLAVGGTALDGRPMATVERYSPATGGWRRTGSLHTARLNPTLVQLRDGRVLAVGGATATGETATAEIYDPKTGRWTEAGSMSTARESASAAVLPDGRVLVAGGHVQGKPVTTVDIYDPRTGTWARGADLPSPRAAAASATLADGRVLLAGGMGTGGPLRTVVVYSPSTGSWTAVAPMHHARFYAGGVRLANGKVLVAGDTAQAELYDPTANTWTYVGSLAAPTQLASMVLLPNGHVFVAGGESAAGTLRQVDEFDPSTNRWLRRPALPTPSAGAVTAAVPAGVLVAGGLAGSAATATSYVYTQTGASVPSTRFDSTSDETPAASRPGGGSSGWSNADTMWLILGGLIAALAVVFVFAAAGRRRSRSAG